jgi:hypothetical protein
VYTSTYHEYAALQSGFFAAFMCHLQKNLAAAVPNSSKDAQNYASCGLGYYTNSKNRINGYPQNIVMM